jgi:hypothetical protein
MLALSKGPNRVGVSLISPDTDQVSEKFFSSYVEFRTMGKVQKPVDSDCCAPFRFSALDEGLPLSPLGLSERQQVDHRLSASQSQSGRCELETYLINPPRTKARPCSS